MRPRNFNKKKLFLIPFGIAACLSLVSYIVMQLWNHLLPDILHAGTITFWQAMGIFILCKILFGFGGRGKFGGGNHWMRDRMAERFRNMEPGEREKFRAEMKDRMCGWGRRFSGAPGSGPEKSASSFTNDQL
ncbi:hypothetical protein [Hufsiella ginkgonis]|uniref:hypothetical protein n=1 Tax=Hufsiella ginkgonis TaxID=2695274 RepID=UPI0019257FDD|nr:hypothetical protein [Hufsiella ginkgonis]